MSSSVSNTKSVPHGEPASARVALTTRTYWSSVLAQEGVEATKAEQTIRFWEDARGGDASSTHGRSLVLTLHNLGTLPDAKVAHAVSQRHSMPLVGSRELTPSKDAIRLIGEDKVKKFYVLPLVDGRVVVADPEIQGFASVRMVIQRNMRDAQMCVASVSDIETALDRLHEDERRASVLVESEDVPSAEMIERDLERAFRLGASDLHLKPGEHTHIVTARVDSECIELRRLSGAQRAVYVKSLMLSSRRGLRGEELGNGQGPGAPTGPRNRPLDSQNSYESQDGASVREYAGKRVALRYSSIPVPLGMSIVVRLIDHSRITGLHLRDLGYLPKDEDALREAFQRRSGLNMLLGSTGSGKSTTLYTGIKEINMDKNRVITIEDPIECLFTEGPVQIELSEQLTFAKIKKAVMRHDPDVILVAEVRDTATVQLLEWATLSSHLTWGTLHADTPFLAIRRLLELELDVVTLSGVVDTFCAQVLGRRVCPHCRREHPSSRLYLDRFGAMLDRYEVRSPAFWAPNPEGCAYCERGEKGRALFAELYKFDEEDRDQIARQGNKYNPVEARKHACERVSNPLKTLREDAVIKAAMGWVSLDEALRQTSTSVDS